MAWKKVERFEDLFVWQKAHQLVLCVYYYSAIYAQENEPIYPITPYESVIYKEH